MPTIVELANCKIAMYADDHRPPHFHLLGPGGKALIRLSDLTVMQGRCLRRDLDEAVNWARANIERLNAEWRRLNERE